MAEKTHDFNTIEKIDVYNLAEYEDTQTFNEGQHNVKYKFKLDVPTGVKYTLIIEARVSVKEAEG